MYYHSKNSVQYDSFTGALEFRLKDQEVIERFMELLEEMAMDVIKGNDYDRTLELVSMIVEAEAELKKFNQPKLTPIYASSSNGLLEDE